MAAPTIPSAISPWPAGRPGRRLEVRVEHGVGAGQDRAVSGSVTPRNRCCGAGPFLRGWPGLQPPGPAVTTSPRHGIPPARLGMVPARTYRVARSDAGAAPPGWGNRAVRPRVLREDGPAQEGSAVEDVGELGTQCGLGLGAGDALDHLALENSSSAGMAVIWYSAANSWLASTSTLATVSLSDSVPAISSRTGAIMVQGGTSWPRSPPGPAWSRWRSGRRRRSPTRSRRRCWGRGHDGCSFRGGGGVRPVRRASARRRSTRKLSRRR